MATDTIVEVWGIPTCGTVRKALKYLDAKNIAYEFRDFRKTPPTKVLLRGAVKSLDAPRKLFNTSGASYRDGGWGAKAAMMSAEHIIDALLEDPMLIKRPVIRSSKGTAVGFDEKKIDAILP